MKLGEEIAKIFIEKFFKCSLIPEPLGKSTFPDFGCFNNAFEVTSIVRTNRENKKSKSSMQVEAYFCNLYKQMVTIINKHCDYKEYGYYYKIRFGHERKNQYPIHKIVKKIEKEFPKLYISGNETFQIEITQDEYYKTDRNDFLLKKDNNVTLNFNKSRNLSMIINGPYIKGGAFYLSEITKEVGNCIKVKNERLLKFLEKKPSKYKRFILVLVNYSKIPPSDFDDYYLEDSINEANKYLEIFIIDKNSDLIKKLI